MEHLANISQYLKELNKSAVTKLGLDLGISYSRLTTITDLANFIEEMLHLWLQGVDQVEKSGIPTWERLVKSLKRVGQTGIAMKIERDQLAQQ